MRLISIKKSKNKGDVYTGVKLTVTPNDKTESPKAYITLERY